VPAAVLVELWLCGQRTDDVAAHPETVAAGAAVPHQIPGRALRST